MIKLHSYTRHTAMRSLLFFIAAIFGSLSLAAAQQPRALNFVAVSGTPQTVGLNQALPQPFVVNATDDGGHALVGLTIGFEVNACLEFSAPPPGSPGCPPDAIYGHFPGPVRSVTAITDANGNATSPAFTSGSIGGTYTVFAYILQAPYPAIAAPNPLFTVAQIDPATAAAPTLSSWASALLTALFAICGIAGLSRFRSTDERR